MKDTYKDVAKADEIARQWPDGREAPQLILDIANYMRAKEWRSFGATRLLGDRMDDHWIENGADLWRDFGCFMRLPDGSRVAEWFRDGGMGAAPIVLIGSEGEQRVLAEDLPSFLTAWALARFDDKGDLVAKSTSGTMSVDLPSDLLRGDDEDDDGVEDGRPAFAVFLESKLGAPLSQHLKQKPDDAPFEAFFTELGNMARAEMAANENLLAIAKVIDAYVPRGKEVWQREMFSVAAVGDRIEIGGKGDPRKALPEAEAAAIRPYIKAERDRRAGGIHAPRGLWHSANIALYPDGRCQLPADWASEPNFRHGPKPTAAEFAADQARFPKSARWIEPWMKDLK